MAFTGACAAVASRSAGVERHLLIPTDASDTATLVGTKAAKVGSCFFKVCETADPNNARLETRERNNEAWAQIRITLNASGDQIAFESRGTGHCAKQIPNAHLRRRGRSMRRSRSPSSSARTRR